MTTRMLLSRRRLLQAGLATGASLLLPRVARAAPALVNPYSGAIPLVFPLASGTYQTPLVNNWHAAREGQVEPWSHRTSRVTRAHDGVDLYPLAGQPLPVVYAPLAATVAAVCWRSDNTLSAQVRYQASASTPPPWDYSQAVDTVANLPLYGNFVWLLSRDPASAGMFIFFCHLQNDAVLAGLVPDQPVTAATALGRLGDTGNAAGTPQLHVELHDPSGTGFRCSVCSPHKPVTSLDPFASLSQAAPRA